MKKPICLILACVLAIPFAATVTGCKSPSISDKPGEDMNPVMSQQQKQLNLAHKDRPVH